MKTLFRWVASAALLCVAVLLVLEAFSPGWLAHQLTRSNQPGGAQPTAHAPAGGVTTGRTYYCPMHPSFRSDRPGNCPICNMALVPLEPSAATAQGPEGHATVMISAARQQLIGVRVEPAERKVLLDTLRVAGRIDYDETRLASVSLRVPAWVEALSVRAVGDRVEAGAPLASLYSPELNEAERNLLIALDAQQALRSDAAAEMRAFADANVRLAEQRLLQLDLTAEQVRDLGAKRELARTTMLFAKQSGIVVKRNVTVGSYVEPGMPLFEIADLATVWVVASVLEYDAARVVPGMSARIDVVSLPGEVLPARIAYVSPFLDEPTRTVAVRLEMDNAERRLKPGMYATVQLDVDLGEQLVVDDQAVVFTGERELVFVQIGDAEFEPREVTVGARAQGQAAIMKGLAVGEKVVTQATFLIDSESRLRSALSQGSHHH